LDGQKDGILFILVAVPCLHHRIFRLCDKHTQNKQYLSIYFSMYLQKGSQMKDVLFFDSMLTPKIITFVYWLLLIVAVVVGIGSWSAGYGGFTFGKFMMGLGIIIGGGVGARIWCELLIVLFKINENIKKMADK